MTTIFKAPIEAPAEGCTPAAPVPITSDQQSKYDELLKTIKSWETLPTGTNKDAKSEPLSDSEKLWLSRECLLRYLRATKWHLDQSAKRIKDTLIWRREYGTNTFTADYISEENATGKQVLFGYDNEGRPCLYLLPNKQNTKNSPKQVQHLVYMLERTLDIAPPGQETLALLIDFRNSSAGSNPSIATGREVLHILQNYYPERLGRALITHLPWYVSAFLKVISPFIDPVTKTKIRYNEALTEHIPAAQLMKNAGGDCEFEYDHATYWPSLAELAEKKSVEKKARFEKAGKHIGESEVYLWGGDEPSVYAAEERKEQEDKKEETPAVGEVKSDNGALDSVTNGVEKLDVKDGEANGNVKGVEATPTGGAEEKVTNEVEVSKAGGELKAAA